MHVMQPFALVKFCHNTVKIPPNNEPSNQFSLTVYIHCILEHIMQFAQMYALQLFTPDNHSPCYHAHCNYSPLIAIILVIIRNGLARS